MANNINNKLKIITYKNRINIHQRELKIYFIIFLLQITHFISFLSFDSSNNLL